MATISPYSSPYCDNCHVTSERRIPSLKTIFINDFRLGANRLLVRGENSNILFDEGHPRAFSKM